MSKNISSNLKTALQQETTTFALCWKVTLTDNTVYGFTSVDIDLVVDGVTYLASTGYGSSNVATSLELGADNLEIYGLINSESISEIDIGVGKLDGAQIEGFLVDYTDISKGTLVFMKGGIGEITVKNGQFVAQLDFLITYLDQTIGEVYSYNCRVAQLGDARCKINTADYTFTGAVTTVITNSSFKTTLIATDNYFTYGVLTWTTGSNSGVVIEIKKYLQENGAVTLFAHTPWAIHIGDTFSVVAGCDRTPDTCRGKFNNFENYRGEPFLKGIDQLYSYPPLNPSGIG